MKKFLLTLWYRYKEWRFERKCIKHLGMKPKKVYISEEAYDELIRVINEPPDPKTVEALKKILNRKTIWEEK